MKIDKLRIENFHCFKEADFEFASCATVFIGKNGTGKSSMLKALCDSLSFIFNKSNGSWGYSSLANEVTDLGVSNIGVREIYHNGKIADYVSLKANRKAIGADSEHINLNWELRKNSYEKSTLQSSLYKKAYIDFRAVVESTDLYPLLVYYSDRYPHINTNLGVNVKSLLNEDDIFSRTWYTITGMSSPLALRYGRDDSFVSIIN